MRSVNLAACRCISTLFITLFVSLTDIHAQTITTVAGSGADMSSVGYWGDGGPAILASTPSPDAICIDTAGNLYLTCINSIRRIDAATGIISIVAGDGRYVDSGDGGPAVNAGMKYPNGLCLDKNGNLYVTEYGGHRVRKINLSTGIITTVAGNGIKGYSGDDGPAIDAQFDTPNGICIDDSSNLYVTDSYNGRVRKVNQTTGIITTLTNADFPHSICIDKAGNVYTTQTTRVYKFDPATGTSSVVAGNGIYAYSGDGGLATEASIFDATGICVDAEGDIYIAEYDDSRIRKVDHETGIITTIAGTGNNGFSGDNGALLNADLYHPRGIITDGKGNLYVCDSDNNRIRKMALTTCYWTGNYGYSWEDPRNWNTGSLPGDSTDVIIRAGNVVIQSNAVIRSLYLKPNVIITVNAPYTLSILFANTQ